MRIFLKILMIYLIFGFSFNFIMQTISYRFYKNAKQIEVSDVVPEYLQFNEKLTGFGTKLDSKSDTVIIYFGGSNDIAYNSVAKFSAAFTDMFISVDYYGTQKSVGKMNLSSMEKSALDIYEWTRGNYPEKKVIVMGHSYGTGMATYLASEKEVKGLILLSAYRDTSDLYNKIMPFFIGINKVFISNDISLKDYAPKVTAPVIIIGSDADKVLSAELQGKVAKYFSNVETVIFANIPHESYLGSDEVIEYINKQMLV